MTVRAGRGWGDEATTERDEPSGPNTPGMIFFPFLRKSESTAGTSPQKYSPAVPRTQPTPPRPDAPTARILPRVYPQGHGETLRRTLKCNRRPG